MSWSAFVWSANDTVSICLLTVGICQVVSCPGWHLSRTANFMIGKCHRWPPNVTVSKCLNGKWLANVMFGKCHGLRLSDRQMLVGKRRPANVWSANVRTPLKLNYYFYYTTTTLKRARTLFQWFSSSLELAADLVCFFSCYIVGSRWGRRRL